MVPAFGMLILHQNLSSGNGQVRRVSGGSSHGGGVVREVEDAVGVVGGVLRHAPVGPCVTKKKELLHPRYNMHSQTKRKWQIADICTVNGLDCNLGW